MRVVNMYFMCVCEMTCSLFFLSVLPVKISITLDVSGPEILITARPEIPGPDESAKIVIIYIIAFY